MSSLYTFNKNGAHVRLFKFIWDIDATEFKTICPYFWAWVATLILTPFILIKLLIIDVLFLMVICNIFEKILRYKDDVKENRKTEARKEEILKKEVLKFTLLEFIKNPTQRSFLILQANKYFPHIWGTRSILNHDEDKLKDYRKKFYAMADKIAEYNRERREELEEVRKRRAEKIIKLTKPVNTVVVKTIDVNKKLLNGLIALGKIAVMIVIPIVILSLLGIVVYNLCQIQWLAVGGDILNGVYIVGTAILKGFGALINGIANNIITIAMVFFTAGLLLSIIGIVLNLGEYLDDKNISIKRNVGKGFKFIFKPITITVKFIWKTIRIAADVILSIYKQHCHIITWEGDKEEI